MISNLLNNMTPPNIISWILLGIVAAFTVYLLDRREVRGGLAATTFAGVAGGLAGGLVASLFSPNGESNFNDASFILAVSIGLLLSTIQRIVMGEKQENIETPRYDYELGRVAYYSQVTPLSESEKSKLRPTYSPQYNQPVNPVVLEKYLAGINYPVKKQELLTHARMLGASDPVLYTLELLPEKEYTGPIHVAQELSAQSS